MAGSAAGGFMARAFESMLKECANKKYNALQSAIQTYFDSGKDINWQSNIGEIKQLTSEAPKESGSSEYNSGAENSDMGFNHSSRAPSAAENVEPTIRSASSSGSITTTLEIAGHTLGEAEADLVLNPLRLAFETKNIKMVELALDCLHKLIEYNHLEGDPGLDGGKNSKLLTDILNMVCSCVDNSAPDSTTLQVLKVLLTAIASTKIRVHGEPLVGIIRVCSNIALNSKSPINQATSKAMLTQMLGIIFFRQMESDMESSNSLETGPAHAENRSNLVVSEVSSYDHNDSKITSDDILSLKHLSRTSLRSVEGIQNFASGTDIKIVEAILKKAVDLEEGEVQRVMGAKCMSIEQRDALLLLYTLCKMGMKEGNDEVTTKARILSLELLQDLLDEVGSSSTKNLQLIDSIRAHLSYDLLRASVSQSPALFQCATGIFSVLLLRYRESLKAEIEVFFPMIVLRSLDASDLNQKLVVLRMLEKICKDPQMLVDLYINYDCDIEEPNLFERMVATLSKIAQGTQYVDPRSSNASQSLLVKTSSLQGLVNILKSLVTWEKSHRNFEKQNKESFGDVSPKDLDDSKSGEDSPSNFENLKDYKSTTEAAVSEFNQQPERGIEHLISSQLVEKTPLSATIGDYLGQHDEFALAAMHAYVESMNFSGLKFDFAIREFFKGFRIPGDAQMIDCIMEKFAECYCAQNPGLFKNANTAYVLAYAIIMLNADAHSPMGSLKMSKSDFVHMNAISSVEESAPQELLKEIYDNIVKEGIKIKDAPAGNLRNRKQDLEVNERGQLVGVLNLDCPKRNSSTDFKSQSEKILKKIQSMIKDQCGKGRVFYTSHRIELVHPMVEVVGWPLLATFSVTMGEADNTSRIGICMQGFKEGIHITHVLGVDTVRYAFLTSLLRYNFLHAPRDMRGKNVEALRTLLGICETDIYALKDSWLAILECISRLEYLVSSPAMTATLMQGSNQISRDAILHSLRELSGKPIQQVFMNSVKLPSESVIEFFTALCNVSAEELKQTPIRTFSLQKIVEISYYNMARIHMVWARIWSVLAQHFIFAGSHADEKVAMYAIDSLQRLGMKYLEHTELVTFTFQKGILKPFVTLMQSGRSESIRRLILDCVVQIIKSKAGIIKSGWQSVFMIFKTAANDDLESIVESAFENTEQVILEHFNQIVGDCFLDCLSCLIVFAKNKISVSLSLKAIALLHICEDRLAEGLMRVGSLNTVDNTADETCYVAERYWFPMLSGLSDLISDPRSEVRNCALEVLFDLLNERGSKFSSSFWENIFLQILFPIFDHVRHAGNESFISSGCERPRESTVHALQLLCDLFNTFYKDVYFMLGPLLSLLLDCAKRTDQSVVSISLGALTRLIEAGGNQFTSDDWATLLQSIRDAIYTTQPLELLNDLGIENQKHNKVLSGDLDSPSPVSLTNGDANAPNHNQETVNLPDEGSQGLSSPSNTATRPGDAGSLQRTQTLGQKIMGNMRDNLFTRSFKLKPKNFKTDAVVPSSPSKLPDATSEADAVDDEESPMMGTVRSKCITQLLLLGAIDSIQIKYWNKLNAPEKLTIMEILFSLLEFAASYNSYTNLRLRMQQIPAERPPLNLLRQELTGTCIYLDILQKITAAVNIEKEEAVEEEKLERAAKEKLVSFCEKVLREASDFQSTMEEMSNMDIHRVLELRSPIIVKVLKGMCQMNPKIFKDHLRDFYPSITKLVCCEQMEVRGALADLLSMQLTPLLQ